METLQNFFKKKAVRQFLYFGTSLLAMGILVWPMTGTSQVTSSPTSNQASVQKISLSQARDVYQKPSTQEKILMSLPQGTSVTLLSESDGWQEILLADGESGWIQAFSSEELIAQMENPVDKVAIVSAASTPVYSAPDSQEFPFAEMPQDTYALLLYQGLDGWLQIQYQSQVAWIQAKDAYVSELYMGNENGGTPLYQEASDSSSVLITIPAKTIFTGQNLQGSYIQVSYQGHAGYVNLDQANFAIDGLNDLYKLQANLPVTLSDGKLLATKLNETPLYAEDNLSSTTLGTVAAGTVFPYQDRVGDFYQVSIGEGQTAYLPYWLVLANFATIETDDSLPNGLKNALIVIDPGHGGDDPGAVVSFASQDEADYTLATAQALKASLEQAGATVVMTRDSDTAVSLIDRAKVSRDQGADAFISLHFDSGPIDSVSGTTTYFYNSLSYNLGKTVNKYLGRQLAIPNQGLKFQNFQVLRENTQPSLLLELGYLNNQGDYQLISSKSYQEQVATAITQALAEYFQ